MSRHTEFILSPITNILEEVAAAHSGVGRGMQTYPLSEYILQSIFLKMTGAQEQKMKCICWDIATVDYKYRYDRFSKDPIGEGSMYKDKSKVYNDVLEQIRKFKPGFSTSTFNKADISARTTNSISEIFSKNNMSVWDERNFQSFINDKNLLRVNQFLEDKALLQTDLQKRYEQLYDHRNRCAHNTWSYQENLPTLKTLAAEDYKYDNYFVRFALLILIDTIFIELYQVYLNMLDESLV